MQEDTKKPTTPVATRVVHIICIVLVVLVVGVLAYVMLAGFGVIPSPFAFEQPDMGQASDAGTVQFESSGSTGGGSRPATSGSTGTGQGSVGLIGEVNTVTIPGDNPNSARMNEIAQRLNELSVEHNALNADKVQLYDEMVAEAAVYQGEYDRQYGIYAAAKGRAEALLATWDTGAEDDVLNALEAQIIAERDIMDAAIAAMNRAIANKAAVNTGFEAQIQTVDGRQAALADEYAQLKAEFEELAAA